MNLATCEYCRRRGGGEVCEGCGAPMPSPFVFGAGSAEGPGVMSTGTQNFKSVDLSGWKDADLGDVFFDYVERMALRPRK